MSRFGLTLMASLLLLTTGGCSWGRQRVNVEGMHARAEALRPGVSTQEHVLAAMGTHPNRVMDLKNDKEAWVYIFGDGKTEGFNMFIVAFQKSNIGLDTAMLTFDANGVLEDMWISNNSQELEWELWPFGDEDDLEHDQDS
ncbi:MAG: hypothetical protein DRQ55_10150 [Planctomycetota bacterium]|nr:MAG: hypothetical protein DRQ55_10150 [Planctomycetota bacterium]